MTRRIYRLWWATSRPFRLALLLSLFLPGIASAHGATVVQVDDDFGPYHVVAVTGSPTPSGTLLTIVLTTAGDSSELSPITGATVRARIEAPGSSLVIPVPAEASRASSGYYETTLNVPGDGDAKVSLQIDGPKGQASTAFTLKRPAAWTGWLTLGAEVLFAGAVLTYLLVFAANSLRARQKSTIKKEAPADDAYSR